MASIINQVVEKLTNDKSLKEKVIKPAEQYVNCRVKPYIYLFTIMFVIIASILVYIVFAIRKINILIKTK